MKSTSLLAMLLLSPLLATSGGCAITHDMWQQANARQLEYPAVAGCLDKPGQDHPQAIVIEYPVLGMGWTKDRRFYVMVPLKGDGAVPEPHAYHGSWRRWSLAERAIPPEQVEKVSSVVFSPSDFQAAKQAMRSLQFRPLNRTPGGVSTIESMRMSTTQNVSIVAYWPAGTAPEARFNPDKLPPDATFMVLPSRQPRPESDRSANISVATALTPLTVAADVAIDPIAMVAWWIQGDR